jgi:hypothetical protein
LVEIYDLNPEADSRLANLSSRALVTTGENVVIGGVIVGEGGGVNGAGSARVVVRGMGPSLTQSGVVGALQDPELLLFDPNGNVIATNNNWRDGQATELTAVGLAPDDDREAALVATLRRGGYTAVVRGTAGTTGVALVEVYYLQ